jgi:hypothetical protein
MRSRPFASERGFTVGILSSRAASTETAPEPGTVFITEHLGNTVWIVANRSGHSVRYARVTPGHLAGLVEVRCSTAEGGGTTAEIRYELTALSDDARPELERFAAGYDAEILRWEQAIADAIAAGGLS